jgi:hypothetical protein
MTKPIERPILFSGEMVRALLEGRKTQTRRIIKPQPDIADPELEKVLPAAWEDGFIDVKCPYGIIGDRLWVRETFCAESQQTIHYRADGWEYDGGGGWKPSIHMPRWASRIDLEVTAVRVERLQDISEADAVAEGIESFMQYGQQAYADYLKRRHCVYDSRFSFKSLWESINGFDSWQVNPWVWVIEFRRVPHDQD